MYNVTAQYAGGELILVELRLEHQSRLLWAEPQRGEEKLSIQRCQKRSLETEEGKKMHRKAVVILLHALEEESSVTAQLAWVAKK